MKAARIVSQARVLLQDLAGVRWADAELLAWLNAAQRQVVAVRPDAKAKRADLELTPGFEQTIPTDGIRLLSVLHNVGGRAITIITRDELNAIDVNWPKSAPRAGVRHYVYDADTPREFDVWPPVPTSTTAAKVRIAYAVLPTDCANVEQEIDLDDIYEGPLTDFICFRAFMGDSDNPQNGARAADHLAAFMQALTGKLQSDQATQPRRK